MLIEELPIVGAIRIIAVVRHSDEVRDATLIPFFPGTNVGFQALDFSADRHGGRFSNLVQCQHHVCLRVAHPGPL